MARLSSPGSSRGGVDRPSAGLKRSSREFPSAGQDLLYPHRAFGSSNNSGFGVSSTIRGNKVHDNSRVGSDRWSPSGHLAASPERLHDSLHRLNSEPPWLSGPLVHRMPIPPPCSPSSV